MSIAALPVAFSNVAWDTRRGVGHLAAQFPVQGLTTNDHAPITGSVLLAAGVTDPGLFRPANEDCFAIDEPLGLCVVADGMGGHNAGEVASRMVVDGVIEHVKKAAELPRGVNGVNGVDVHRPSLHPFGQDPAGSRVSNLLRNAVLLAGVQILETAVTNERYAGMGTTVVAAQIVGDRLTVAHVGDSRLYRMADGMLHLLTADDSWMATVLARDPAANVNAYRNHPMRHALTNVVGGRARTNVHIVEEKLRDGDCLVLTTDGVHGVLEDDVLQSLLVSDDAPDGKARRIVKAALARGACDNCTAVVAEYRQSSS
jgi:serine/threonine protein phosphatase PrpC